MTFRLDYFCAVLLLITAADLPEWWDDLVGGFFWGVITVYMVIFVYLITAITARWSNAALSRMMTNHAYRPPYQLCTAFGVSILLLAALGWTTILALYANLFIAVHVAAFVYTRLNRQHRI